jgi:hypothetical protein
VRRRVGGVKKQKQKAAAAAGSSGGGGGTASPVDSPARHDSSSGVGTIPDAPILELFFVEEAEAGGGASVARPPDSGPPSPTAAATAAAAAASKEGVNMATDAAAATTGTPERGNRDAGSVTAMVGHRSPSLIRTLSFSRQQRQENSGGSGEGVAMALRFEDEVDLQQWLAPLRALCGVRLGPGDALSSTSATVDGTHSRSRSSVSNIGIDELLRPTSSKRLFVNLLAQSAWCSHRATDAAVEDCTALHALALSVCGATSTSSGTSGTSGSSSGNDTGSGSASTGQQQQQQQQRQQQQHAFLLAGLPRRSASSPAVLELLSSSQPVSPMASGSSRNRDRDRDRDNAAAAAITGASLDNGDGKNGNNKGESSSCNDDIEAVQQR